MGSMSLYLSGGDASWMLLYKLCGFALLYYCLTIGLLEDRDYFSPFTLFSITPFSILIYSDYLSDSLLPLPGPMAIFNIVLGQACFLFGLTLFRSRARKKRQQLDQAEFQAVCRTTIASAGGFQRGPQDRDQQPEDHGHHEHLDQCETASANRASVSHQRAFFPARVRITACCRETYPRRPPVRKAPGP